MRASNARALIWTISLLTFIGITYWTLGSIIRCEDQRSSPHKDLPIQVNVSASYKMSGKTLNGEPEEMEYLITLQILASPTWKDGGNTTYNCLVDQLEVSDSQGHCLFRFVRDPLMAHSYHTNPRLKASDRQWWYHLFSVNLANKNLYEDDSLLENFFSVTANDSNQITEVIWPVPWRKFWGNLLRFHPFEMTLRQKLYGPVTLTKDNTDWKAEWNLDSTHSLLHHQAHKHCRLVASAHLKKLDGHGRIRQEGAEPITSKVQ